MSDTGLDFGLGEMADTIRETTRRFAKDKIEPIAAEIDEKDEFPRHLWPQMGELGLHGITVEEEDGGLGLGYLEHVVAQEEVARASGSVGLSYGAHSNLCINQIRGSPTAELVFNDCFVAPENILGNENKGVEVLMSGLDYERTILAGMQIGIMQACLDVVLPYVRERKQFGKPIGSFQLMQAKIADMYVALNSSRAYVYSVAKACDAGKTTRHDAAGAILLASENAVKVANEAVQALGGAGYTKDWPVERYYRDAKLLDIGAGTNEIRRMLIGRELIGV